MAKPQGVESQDSTELQADDGATKSQRREDSDAAALKKAGKNPVLRARQDPRNFNLMSMFGFSCLILGTWQGALVYVSKVDGIEPDQDSCCPNFCGGPAGLMDSFLVVWAGTFATFVSLAELASMAPTAGGQYHWVSILEPQSCQKLFSYITGWLMVAGWQAGMASSAYLEGVLFQNLIELVWPTYVPHRWHVPPVYLAPHSSPRKVFTTFVNGGDWSNHGLWFLVGTSRNAFAFLGADGVYHMTEEVKNAAIVVPRSIVYELIMNGAVGLDAVIALLFCISDPNVVLSTSLTYPQSILTMWYYLHWPAFMPLTSSLPSFLLWPRITGSIQTPNQVPSSLDPCHRANSSLPGCAGNLVWSPWRVPGLSGTAINAFGCIYLLIVGIFASFPPTKEVHAQTMNHSSLVMGSRGCFQGSWD
ncbi:hypothetical protein MMC29_004257, partial [Sticta canariensis]|nr:hypothetical protein [Sticta canariensis]